MNKEIIYLDNAATTFPKPEKVYHEMDYVNRNFAVNAGRGSYYLAKKATNLIDKTRENLLQLLSCENLNVIFSSSATAAINSILRGIEWNNGDVVYVSPYEHNALMRTLHAIQKEQGIIIEQLAIDPKSLEVDLVKTEYLFSQRRPKMVCFTHISNVTGYILPIYEIALLAKKYDSITMIDGAQGLGLVPFRYYEKLMDFYVFAGHKTLYGPFGIAGFYYNNMVELKNIFTGGTGSDSLNLDMPLELPERYEPASHNIVAIAGLNAALNEIDITKINNHEKHLSEYLLSELSDINNIKLYLPDNVNNHIGIISFNIEGYKAEDVGTILDEEFKIAVRTGYHCAPLIHRFLKDEEFMGTVRVGIGQFNTTEDIDQLIYAVRDIVLG